MNARWLLPPWRVRFSSVNEPPESIRVAVEVLREREQLRADLLDARREVEMMRGLLRSSATERERRLQLEVEQHKANCAAMADLLAKAEGRERMDGRTHVVDPSMTGVKR